MKRKQGNAILPKPSGRQFETILSINKTRDEDKIFMPCRARLGWARLFLSEEVTKMDMKNLNRTQKLAFSGDVMG